MDCGSLKEGVQARGRILSLTGRFSSSSVVRILGNKPVTLGYPLLPTFIYIIYILFGGELSYTIPYLLSLRSTLQASLCS
jgi:hypothetical protein